MDKIQILWADDEIDLLKPHVLFLEDKGYKVDTVVSGTEAIEEIQDNYYDVVFLDENMPGLTGLETLSEIKKLRPEVPVVMITKNEEEYLMEDAIGSKISDYLIKPVNPRQILLTIKRLIESKRLVSEKITSSYQQDFRNLAMQVNERLTADEWITVYKKIVHWDMELETSDDEGMKEVLLSQKTDANANFFKFIEENYLDWLHDRENAPIMSHNMLYRKVFPLLEQKKPVFFFLIDNLRYDQWKMLQPKISELFQVKEDTAYYSIVPTATTFSRNSIFSGLLPSQLEERLPGLWVGEEEEGGKNLHEEEFLQDYLKRLHKNIRFNYNKITQLDAGRAMVENWKNMMNYDLNVIIYNFVDLLSHVRTEMAVLKELAEDEAAYRSLTLSWFEHSPLYDFMKKIAGQDVNVVITTDHGSIRVRKPAKVIGDRNTTTNLRYKQGKNLNFDKKEVFHVRNPKDAFLPSPHMSSSYIFAREDYYFVYPNNYNHFVNFYKDTFQHGGVSLEEMMIPIITLQSK